MPNTENILKVADAIEQHSIADLGFNMGVVHSTAGAGVPDMSGHNCGTVACIAGWTNRIFKTTTDSAHEVLGLDEEQADALFIPEGWTENTIGPDQAVRTLRNLASTGEVNWMV